MHHRGCAAVLFALLSVAPIAFTQNAVRLTDLADPFLGADGSAEHDVVGVRRPVFQPGAEELQPDAARVRVDIDVSSRAGVVALARKRRRDRRLRRVGLEGIAAVEVELTALCGSNRGAALHHSRTGRGEEGQNNQNCDRAAASPPRMWDM